MFLRFAIVSHSAFISIQPVLISRYDVTSLYVTGFIRMLDIKCFIARIFNKVRAIWVFYRVLYSSFEFPGGIRADNQIL